MTQTLATTTADEPIARRLSPYEGGLSAEAPRVDALAVISAGYRAGGEGSGAGLPKASQRGDEKQIHLHDPEMRAPGLAAALEASAHRSLQIAFPLNDGFIIQRFTRYSATRLELYGDETSIVEIIKGPQPEHRRHMAGSDEYERLVKTCKADTRIYFCLAEWTPTGPQVVFPDGLGVYAIRTTSQHSVRSIQGTLAYTARFTNGGIAGLPFLLSVDHREVAGPDGTKRNIPVWTITTKPPEGARLSSRTFRQLATSALREGAQLMLAPPSARTIDEMADDGPLVDEPTEAEVQLLERGGVCDYEHWIKTWHAMVRDTAFESEGARAEFIQVFTDGRTDSLADYLKTATEADATTLIAALVTTISQSRGAASAARYEAIFGSDDDGTAFADLKGLPVVPAGDGTSRPKGVASEAPATAPELSCSTCGKPIMAQDGEPINASQADTIKERFGGLFCRDDRPKSKKAEPAQSTAF